MISNCIRKEKMKLCKIKKPVKNWNETKKGKQ